MEKEILKKYFQDKMKQKDIANELNVSKYKVSRVVTKDERYIKEKGRRKKENRIKNKKETKEYIKNERIRRNDNFRYEQLKQAHIQATIELSGGRKGISNRKFRDWNTSAYRYDQKSQSYKLRKEINAGSDVPKKIKWKM